MGGPEGAGESGSHVGWEARGFRGFIFQTLSVTIRESRPIQSVHVCVLVFVYMCVVCVYVCVGMCVTYTVCVVYTVCVYRCVLVCYMCVCRCVYTCMLVCVGVCICVCVIYTRCVVYMYVFTGVCWCVLVSGEGISIQPQGGLCWWLQGQMPGGCTGLGRIGRCPGFQKREEGAQPWIPPEEAGD